MRLTVPQIIMLNHGASVNKRRSDVRMSQEKDNPTTVRNQVDAHFHVNEPVWKGKRWDELTSDEMAAYVKA